MATGELIEEVALNFEEVADATRRINATVVGGFLGGIGVGVAIGFFFGYRHNRETLRLEAFKNSEEEVEKIRENYRNRVTEVPSAVPEKPSVEKIIEERGYSVGVETSARVEEIDLSQRPLPPPVPIDPHVRVFRTTEGEKSKDDNWSYPDERNRRSPDTPYIIHQDEYTQNETDYMQVTYTYFAGDDVLVDTDDTILNNRETLIGSNTLNRFGHGSDDVNILYVRNDHLQLDIEICRSSRSYEQEVQGLEHSDTHERIKRRHDRFDDDTAN